MIELWGHPACESCEEAKKFMGQTPLEWQYVEVDASFEGMIPRLVFEDGNNIVGFPAIKEYVKQKMREMGFPEEMF